jgi:hypothetical protein
METILQDLRHAARQNSSQPSAISFQRDRERFGLIADG